MILIISGGDWIVIITMVRQLIYSQDRRQPKNLILIHPSGLELVGLNYAYKTLVSNSIVD